MRLTACCISGLLVALAACSASGRLDETVADGDLPTEDAGPSSVDSGAPQDAAPDAEPDADRSLSCGDAGFCETRLPLSDLGRPLSLRRVWAVGPKDAWSVTNEGYVLHYDGASWTVAYRAGHELYAVWATTTSVWIGGEAGLLLHRDAAGTWARFEPGHVGPIRDIYGTADDDVWFPNPNGSVDHFDGSALENRPIDVPGLEITTVFGRPGFGTYAAGYVRGEVAVEDMIPWQGYPVPDRPYVFELSTGNITVYNEALTETRGLVPVTGLVTDDPNEGRRIVLIENSRELVLFFGVLQERLYGKRAFVGPDSVTEIDTTEQGVSSAEIPTLIYGLNDIRFMSHIGKVVRFDVTDGSFTNMSLAMGYDFPTKTIYAGHIHAPDVWLVGNGFALKGATQ